MIVIGTLITALAVSGLPEIRFGVARDGSDARELALYKLNKAPPNELFAVPNAQGTGFSHIIGEFESTLSTKGAIAETTAPQFRDAFVSFVNVHLDLFGLQETLKAADVVPEMIDEVDDQVVIRLQQVRNGVPLKSGDLVAVFDADGDLATVSGILRTEQVDAQFWRDPRSVLEETARYFGVDCQQYDGVIEGSRADLANAAIPSNVEYLTQREDGDICYISRSINTMVNLVAAWSVQIPGIKVEVDEESGALLDYVNSNAEYVTDVCNVRRLEMLRETSGFAFGVSSLASPILSAITCGGDDFFGTCYWHLKRPELGLGLQRVYDDTPSATFSEDVQSCSSTSTPTHGASSGRIFDQQNAFFYGSRAREYIHENMYFLISTWTAYKTEFTVRTSYPVSYYVPGFHEVHIHSRDAARIATYMHEYGHHATDAYGITSSTCVNGSNESETLWETVAQMAYYVAAVDDDTHINFSYRSQFSDSGSVRPHVNGLGIEFDDFDHCNNSDIHNEGVGFEEAFWELLWNRDCLATTCTSNTTTAGNNIFIGVTHDNVIKTMGASLAWGLKNTPDGTTYAAFTTSFLSRISTRHDPATAARADLVLSHHGN